jgi:hypothetical protein
MFWLQKAPNNQLQIDHPVQFDPAAWEFREFEGVVHGMSSSTSSSEPGQYWTLYLDEEREYPIWFSAGFSAALVFTYRNHHVKFTLRRRISGPGWFEDDCDACLVSFVNAEQEMVDENVPDPFAPVPVPPRKPLIQRLFG